MSRSDERQEFSTVGPAPILAPCSLLNSPCASKTFVEAGVGAAGLDQFIVRAAFDDVAVVEDQDEVGVADCAQAVSDHETGAAVEQYGQCALQTLLGLRVDGTGRLVEDQQLWVGEQRAGEADHLTLAQ